MNNGTERELTLQQNVESFKKYKLNPRILRDVSKINTQVDFLGVKLNFPLIISPMGYAAQFHKYGGIRVSKRSSFTKYIAYIKSGIKYKS